MSKKRPRTPKEINLDRNWIYSPGRYFKLDWSFYADDKPCFLVALDLSQIQFLVYHIQATNHPRNWKDQRQLQNWDDIQDFYERTVQCLMAGCNVGELINEIRMLRHAIVGTAGFVTDEDGNQVYVDYTDNPTNGAPRSIRSALVTQAVVQTGAFNDLPGLISTIETYIADQGSEWNIPPWLSVGLDVIRLLDELYNIIPDFRFTFPLPLVVSAAVGVLSLFQRHQNDQTTFIGLEIIARAINGGSYMSLFKDYLEAQTPGWSDLFALFSYDDHVTQFIDAVENTLTGDNVVDRLSVLQIALNGQQWEFGQSVIFGNYITDNLDEIRAAIQALNTPELTAISNRIADLKTSIDAQTAAASVAIAAASTQIVTDLGAKLQAIRDEIDSQDIITYIDDIENYLKETANIIGANIP